MDSCVFITENEHTLQVPLHRSRYFAPLCFYSSPKQTNCSTERFVTMLFLRKTLTQWWTRNISIRDNILVYWSKYNSLIYCTFVKKPRCLPRYSLLCPLASQVQVPQYLSEKSIYCQVWQYTHSPATLLGTPAQLKWLNVEWLLVPERLIWVFQ